MSQTESMAELMDSLDEQPPLKQRFVRRQTVKALIQPAGGDDGAGTAQLRLSEYECEHRHEQIQFCHRKQPGIIRRLHSLEQRGRMILVALSAERKRCVDQVFPDVAGHAKDPDQTSGKSIQNLKSGRSAAVWLTHPHQVDAIHGCLIPYRFSLL